MSTTTEPSTHYYPPKATNPPSSISPSSTQPPQNHTTPLPSHPYSLHSPLNTLTLHLPTTPPLSPNYILIYIHGGAFRDPLQTSASILPSLPHLFSTPQTQSHHIAAVISLNYRLAPYPTHPTHPSKPDDAARNARWPLHLDDIRDALVYLGSEGFEYAVQDAVGTAAKGVGLNNGREWILAGHSVGATMALMLALSPWPEDGRWGGPWSSSGAGLAQSRESSSQTTIDRDSDAITRGLRGVVALEGIYDFVSLRDHHFDDRRFYEPWITAVFGKEEEGGWERGNVLAYVREKRGRVKDGVGRVLLAHSRGDEKVEWEQSEGLAELLGDECELLEVEGRHDEVVEGGTEVARCVGIMVQSLVGAS